MIGARSGARETSFATSILLALLALALSPAQAAATVEFAYDGPDQLVLVSRPNQAGSNINRAALKYRELDHDRVQLLLAPAVASAIDECKPKDIKSLTLRPASVPDRIGETTTRYGGLGIFANLPSASRVSAGNWFLAPFFYLEGTVTTLGGATESIELSEVDRIMVDVDLMTQEKFIEEARTKDLQDLMVKILGSSLPKALQKALSSHCQVAPK